MATESDNVTEYGSFLLLFVFLYKILIIIGSLVFQLIWFLIVLIALIFKKRLSVFAPLKWMAKKVRKADHTSDEIIEDNQESKTIY